MGRPDIVKTDQGSQFNAQELVDAMISHGVQLSMDGLGTSDISASLQTMPIAIIYQGSLAQIN